ncbi:MAG: alpha-amylase family glycosyl hydrolase [bacterium]
MTPRRIYTITLVAGVSLLLLTAWLLAGCGQDEYLPTSPATGVPLETEKADPDTFLLRAYGADSVFLAGSMNGWATNDPAYEFTDLGDGYSWQLIVELPAGLNLYKFILWDGAEATWLSDPAAVEIVPDGIHGDPAYWNGVRGRVIPEVTPLASPPLRNELVIYEIAPNDFSPAQTFTGIIAGLTSGPNLVDLGINAIELMPVTVPSYNGWGYDTVMYFAPNPNYGWPSTFATMVNTAHSHGIAVILDMVLNHAAGSCPLRQLDTFSGSYDFTTTEANPWGLVELNWTNPALRDYILDAVCHWVNAFKVDGFRFDYTGGEPYSTWIWLKDELRARYPGLLLIAEDYNYVANSVTHGYDAQWGGNHTDGWGGGGNNFNQVMITILTELGFSTRGITTPSVGAFGTAYNNMWAAANVIGANDQYLGAAPGDGFSDVKYLESHDENRLVWFVDTIGSAGAQTVGGLTKAFLGGLVQMTTVGIPMLYNGQEIGSGEFRPASPTTYQIDWAGGDDDLRAAFKHLIALRLRSPALKSENTFFQWRSGNTDQVERTLVYWRGESTFANDATVVVACNFDHIDHAWTVPFPTDGVWHLLHPVSGAWEAQTVSGGGRYLNLPASTGNLWVKYDGLTGVPE